MKKLLFTIVLVLSTNLYSQQFSFKQLTDMVMNQSLYERNHISKGNDVTNMRTFDTYSYSTPGSYGASLDYPEQKEEEFNELIKTPKIQSDFAEGYNTTSEAAFTFYELRINEDEIILIGDKLPKKESRKLEVYYVRESDYKNILKEINQYCKYVGIKKKKYSEDFIITYKYNNLLIKLEKSEYDNRGGTLQIIMGDFPML